MPEASAWPLFGTEKPGCGAKADGIYSNVWRLPSVPPTGSSGYMPLRWGSSNRPVRSSNACGRNIPNTRSCSRSSPRRGMRSARITRVPIMSSIFLPTPPPTPAVFWTSSTPRSPFSSNTNSGSTCSPNCGAARCGRISFRRFSAAIRFSSVPTAPCGGRRWRPSTRCSCRTSNRNGCSLRSGSTTWSSRAIRASTVWLRSPQRRSGWRRSNAFVAAVVFSWPDRRGGPTRRFFCRS